MAKYTHLSVTERRRLFVFLEMGLSISQISSKLARHRSSLYRELNRNKTSDGYFPVIAHQKSTERAKNYRFNKLHKDGILRDYVIRSLIKGWSPEQIAGRMKYKKLRFYACHETIYQFIYRSQEESLYHCLAYKKPKRKRRF